MYITASFMEEYKDSQFFFKILLNRNKDIKIASISNYISSRYSQDLRYKRLEQLNRCSPLPVGWTLLRYSPLGEWCPVSEDLFVSIAVLSPRILFQSLDLNDSSAVSLDALHAIHHFFSFWRDFPAPIF